MAQARHKVLLFIYLETHPKSQLCFDSQVLETEDGGVQLRPTGGQDGSAGISECIGYQGGDTKVAF